MGYGVKVVAKNPTATHNYTIIDKIEAGIVLSGTEIKSVRSGKVNLKDSYASIQKGEVYIHSMHISPYEHGNIFNKDPLRDRIESVEPKWTIRSLLALRVLIICEAL